jgi:hypothetical protein
MMFFALSAAFLACAITLILVYLDTDLRHAFSKWWPGAEEVFALIYGMMISFFELVQSFAAAAFWLILAKIAWKYLHGMH